MNYEMKKDIDLAILENYDYEYDNHGLLGEGYLKWLDYNDSIFIGTNRNIHFEIEDWCGTGYNKYCEELIQDLIQADLVEKVDDTK